jgi:hypothetical protein
MLLVHPTCLRCVFLFRYAYHKPGEVLLGVTDGDV